MNDKLNSKSERGTTNWKVLAVIILLVVLLVVSIVTIYKSNIKETNEISKGNTYENISNATENTNQSSNSGNNLAEINSNVEYDKNGAFLMGIEEVYEVTEKGTIVTGKIERGTLNLNDAVQIIGIVNNVKTTKVTAIEVLNEDVNSASAGDEVKVVVAEVAVADIQQGQVLAKPNSIKNSTKFDANIYMFAKEEGGRQTPIKGNYRPQFFFRTKDIQGPITLLNNVEEVMPGDNAKINVELIKPMAMEVGTKFTILEGKKTVGNGVVTKVY